MKPTKTWIVVADAAHVRVYETEGLGQSLKELTEMAADADLPAERDLARDRPTRTFESSNPTRHAGEPHETARRALKRDFANTLAEHLNAAAIANTFDRLVIAAAPAVLGDLRNVLSGQTRERIAAEIPKDLLQVAPNDLRKHIEDTILI